MDQVNVPGQVSITSCSLECHTIIDRIQHRSCSIQVGQCNSCIIIIMAIDDGKGNINLQRRSGGHFHSFFISTSILVTYHNIIKFRPHGEYGICHKRTTRSVNGVFQATGSTGGRNGYRTRLTVKGSFGRNDGNDGWRLIYGQWREGQYTCLGIPHQCNMGSGWQVHKITIGLPVHAVQRIFQAAGAARCQDTDSPRTVTRTGSNVC